MLSWLLALGTIRYDEIEILLYYYCIVLYCIVYVRTYACVHACGRVSMS